MRTLRPRVGLALIALTLPIAAGCSSSASDTDSSGGSAGGGSTSTSRSTKASGRDQAVRFATCMRDNGVGAFPDPDASGELTIDGIVNGSSVDTEGATWKQAIDACRDLQPAGFTGRERTAEQQEAALGFAQCMRDNGIKDFPDPAPDAPLIDTNRIPSAAGKGALEIPGFTAAQDACGEHAASAGVKGP